MQVSVCFSGFYLYGNENFGKFTRFPFMIQNFHQASLVFQFWSDMGSDFWQIHKGPPFWFEIFTMLHFFLWHGMWFWPIHNHRGGFHYIEHTILFHETSLFLETTFFQPIWSFFQPFPWCVSLWQMAPLWLQILTNLLPKSRVLKNSAHVISRLANCISNFQIKIK